MLRKLSLDGRRQEFKTGMLNKYLTFITRIRSKRSKNRKIPLRDAKQSDAEAFIGQKKILPPVDALGGGVGGGGVPCSGGWDGGGFSNVECGGKGEGGRVSAQPSLDTECSSYPPPPRGEPQGQLHKRLRVEIASLAVIRLLSFAFIKGVFFIHSLHSYYLHLYFLRYIQYN